MRYADVRDRLKDGTVVFFEAVSPRAKLINVFTGGTVSHCGIVTWITDSVGHRRVMLIESTSGGCRLVNLSAYLGRDMTFIDVNGFDWDTVEDYAHDKTGQEPYGYWDLLFIGAKSILIRMGLATLSTKIKDYHGEVCSEMVADVLLKADVYLPNKMIDPQSLMDYLRENYAKEAFRTSEK